jgi:hypothetical protein
MVLIVSLFLALGAMILCYAIGQGGPVAGLVFLTVLFAGAMVRITQPLLERLRP